MSKPPPIPADQRSPGKTPDIKGDSQGRRDEKTGLQSSQPGDDDVNIEQQGRQGDIHQNTHHQGYQQDR